MDSFLPVRLFHLNAVNTPVENLLPRESFPKVFLKAFEQFPIIHQIANPIIFLERSSGGQIQINPAGVFFRDIRTEDFDKDINKLISIMNIYYSECKINELKELNLKLVFHPKAIIVDAKRKLVAHDISIPNEIYQALPEGKIHTGLRFVFTEGIIRYDLKIEPRFANLEENHVDFNVIIPRAIKTEELLDLVNAQRAFFDEHILPIIAK